MTPPDWTTLRIFLAAVQMGSVTRAADQCGIATSAAAKRIQDLEAEHNVRLLDRVARGVRPTPAGEAFAQHAQALLDLVARTTDDLRAFAAGGVGSVRLHATASAIAGSGLAEGLSDFAAERPGISVELRESTSVSILRDLMEDRADLGIITGANRVPDGLSAHPWREDHLLVVMPQGHALSSRTSVRFSEVLDHLLIGVLEGGALAILLEEEAQRLGRAPRYRFRVGSPDAARRLVAAGLGLTVMPDEVARPSLAALDLCGVKLDEPWARRRLRLIVRSAGPLTIPARLLLDHFLKAAAPGGPKLERES